MTSLKATRLYKRVFRYAAAATVLWCILFKLLRLQDVLTAGVTHNAACDAFQGIGEDVFVIVKTGACEVEKKFPVQLQTTFQCLPSYAVFSDHSGSIEGVQIRDAFEGHVSQKIIQENDEFHVYRKLKEVGTCDGLNSTDLKGKKVAGVNGNTQNRAWVLDKWKFLPLVRKAYEMRPDAKWYFIVETDAHLVWPNLVHWLKQFDPAEPHYIGSQMLIGSQIFAHGGAGTLISNPAMRMVVDHFVSNQTGLEEDTEKHWAGDCILGKAFQEAGVKLLWGWPHFLVHSVSDVVYTDDKYSKRIWCAAVGSYHHMTSDETLDFWGFQKDWFEKHPQRILRHSDVFHEYLMPRIQVSLDNWDNDSPDFRRGDPRPRTPAACRKICEDDEDCLQYSYSFQGCKTSTRVHLGHRIKEENRKFSSGWMTERIEKLATDLAPCSSDDEAWVTDFYGWD